MTARRPRGTGSLYRRGRVWWAKYYRDGQPVCESTGTDQRRKAEKFLTGRLGKVANGEVVGPAAAAATFERLMDLVREDYRVQGRRSLPRAEQAITALTGSFAGVKAARITTAAVRQYLARRLGEGKARATAGYELAILRRGFTLAEESGLVGRAPTFPDVELSNARQGFFEAHEVAALEAELPAYLRPVLRFAVLTGWRKEEILGLTWDRVDFAAGVIRLDVRTTKNDEGRTFPMDVLPPLAVLLRLQRRRRVVGSPWVFHRAGRRIGSFYKAWHAACERAGLANRLLHDCRRTAVRNLERVGVSRSVAMKLTGHKTEAVYRRYAIVNEADLREGVAKLARLGTEWVQRRGVRGHLRLVEGGANQPTQLGLQERRALSSGG